MKLLILSDIHANWPALRSVLEAEPDTDGIICLGDLVNYGPHPVACVQWARTDTVPLWIVQGNHDRAFGCDEDPRCSASFRSLAETMQRHTAPMLDAKARHFLAQLPTTATCVIDDASFVLCHATPSNPLYDYLPGDAGAEQWEEQILRAGRPDFLLVGHTHLPLTRRIARTVVLNPGSVGQPKDGDPRASYAVWHDATVTLRRVAYDVHSVTRDLHECAPPTSALRLSRILLNGGSPALTEAI